MEQNINRQNKRTFAEIAREIEQTWKNVYFGAKPYLLAMTTINSSDKNAPYMFETAESIVSYFLANATYWRGEDATRVTDDWNSPVSEWTEIHFDESGEPYFMAYGNKQYLNEFMKI